ncbi:hypothetical protein [Methylobacterium aerolatum]|uniref:Uncharacterized protein n=1 Tax=Methylobacterium aerolatum TaxID=418708 RepID=A0ABU0I328_9HYPH|nr:hypothetical protein [Methylobacterium aerolatum]MDQ0448079.1 hypothetical protein [Methylobacterium aerolatum]
MPPGTSVAMVANEVAGMAQLKGPRPKTDLKAVSARVGSELIDRMGIRTEAERAEIQIRQARKARLMAQAKALAKTE